VSNVLLKLSSLVLCGTAHRSRTVGKRTPRFPSSAFEKRAKISKVSHSNLHERVEDDALSNMATASNRVSKGAASPSGSHTPSRRSLRQATVQSNGDKVLAVPLVCGERVGWFL